MHITTYIHGIITLLQTEDLSWTSECIILSFLDEFSRNLSGDHATASNSGQFLHLFHDLVSSETKACHSRRAYLTHRGALRTIIREIGLEIDSVVNVENSFVVTRQYDFTKLHGLTRLLVDFLQTNS
eukprot:51448-Amorphochlora_amoeboformis.AAC.1